MRKKIDPRHVEAALSKVTDESSFIQQVLIDLLDWPIDEGVNTVEEITYDWTKDELRAAKLDKKVVEGRIRQLALPDCPWGIFIVEFKNPDVFQSGRGMTVPLRQVLSGLVPRQKKSAHLPSFFREHLLFICTHQYQYFRFVHFKEPGAAFKQPPLASFGWWPGDSTKTVSTYNLPHLAFLDTSATVDDWIDQWTAAFDVERVTKKFYTDYKAIHALFQEKLTGVPPADRAWLASVLLNRLMFVYFLQKKGFLDGGNESYLEDNLAASKGKDKFYTDFLTLLFSKASPSPRRSAPPRRGRSWAKSATSTAACFSNTPSSSAPPRRARPFPCPTRSFASCLRSSARSPGTSTTSPAGRTTRSIPTCWATSSKSTSTRKPSAPTTPAPRSPATSASARSTG
jgi:hypothetical protein